MKDIDLSQLLTETRNPKSLSIDTLSTKDILQVINQEDEKVAWAVEKVIPEITQAVDAIVHAFKNGGRLIYLGAGTSGRIGILDASECPPTYGTPATLIQALIAGGTEAVFSAVENAEDNEALAVADLRAIGFNEQDVLVGITASGRTPYVVAAVVYGNDLDALTVGISCNPNSILGKTAKIAISPIVGPEVITGSSRMKAGTAQKLILNMLTTAAMIKSGKVFGNLMVDVEATNEKLIERQVQIVMQATECSREIAEEALRQTKRHCKTAIVMILNQSSAEEAEILLAKHHGFIRHSIK